MGHLDKLFYICSYLRANLSFAFAFNPEDLDVLIGRTFIQMQKKLNR